MQNTSSKARNVETAEKLAVSAKPKYSFTQEATDRWAMKLSKQGQPVFHGSFEECRAKADSLINWANGGGR